ncbi:DNA polymerase III subunit delta [Neolewinella antarctica]|uniref:DNA polymerase III subunit delta n=1 Tax=Neolewinella antarctica TaxID=442734 RepID=A0ABX0XBT4_9BACT|nr:DNA polymerase III subunit delta [Neolewinella antarctica]NJC26725.1 DNA polymerase-3 subunit delta [Neolewinella antarctica]
MDFPSLKKALRAKDFQPIYLFHGEETYFIDQLEADVQRYALQEHEKAFNETIAYGKDTEYLQIVDAARRFPMMADRQLVILREAQDMRSLKQLEAYAAKPSPTTVLVISHKHKKLNASTKLFKNIKANGVVFEAKALYDNKIPNWINNYLKGKKYNIDQAASQLLAEFLGTSLSKITNEIDKLIINLKPGTTITTAIVEEQVGISKDYNAFELQRAIGMRDHVRAARIVNYFKANPKAGPLPMITGSLYNYFSRVFQVIEGLAKRTSKQELAKQVKVNPYFFDEYVTVARNFPQAKMPGVFALLREYDLKSKGVDSNLAGKGENELLKELVYRLLAV